MTSSLATALALLLALAPLARARDDRDAALYCSPRTPAASGATLPLALRFVNTSASDVRQLRLATNQLFEYRLDAPIPAGQAADVPFAPWYYDGKLSLAAVRAFAADGRLVHAAADATLDPTPMDPDALLLLFDRDNLAPDLLAPHLPEWAASYAHLRQPGRPVPRILPHHLSLQDLNLDLLRDSPVAALVIAAETPQAAAIAAAADRAGLDLWTIDAAGRLARTVAVPPLLRRLALRSHVRSDLFDPGPAQEGRIPPALFRSPAWPLHERVRFLLPVIAVAALLLCLAMLAFRLPPLVKVILILSIAVAGAVGAAVVVRRTPLQRVETLSVLYCDAATGRTRTEHLAAVTSHRAAPVELRFTSPGAGQPRPIMVADADRVAYARAVLHRDLHGLWSVENLTAWPGAILAFASGQWDEEPFSENNRLAWAPSAVPEVRLARDRPLEDACCYVAGKAYRMADVGGAYRPAGPATTIDAAASAPGATPDEFRRRAMRWIARHSWRSDLRIFFGWSPAPPPVDAPDADVTAHGRLLIWLSHEPPEPR